MEAYFGLPEEDLSRQFTEYALCNYPELAECFIDGYFGTRDVNPGFRERLVAFILLDRMGLWGYGLKHDWYRKELTFRKWVESAIDAALGIEK